MKEPNITGPIDAAARATHDVAYKTMEKVGNTGFKATESIFDGVFKIFEAILGVKR